MIAVLPLLLLARHAGTGQIGWLTRPSPSALWVALVAASGVAPALLGILLIAWSGVTIVRKRQLRRVALLRGHQSSVWVIVQDMFRRQVDAALTPRYQRILKRDAGASVTIEHWIRRQPRKRPYALATLYAARHS